MLIFALLLGNFSFAAAPAADPACLVLTMTSPTQELSNGSKLEISYEIQNVCKTAMAVNREILAGGNLKLNVAGPKDLNTQEPVVRFAYASWKTRQKMGTLPPGEKISGTENIMFNGGHYPSGDYKLTAEITMFVFGKDSAATEAVHKLTSNSLALKISN